MIERNLIFQLLILLPFVNKSFQYLGQFHNSNYRTSYGSSSSSGIYDPWFIGISSGLVGLLFITLFVIFIRNVIKKRRERRHSMVRSAGLDGSVVGAPDMISGQNAYVIQGDRRQSEAGWNSPTPNPYNQQAHGTWSPPPNPDNYIMPPNDSQSQYQPTQSGWNQNTDSQFVPAFSYGTQFSNTPRSSNDAQPPRAASAIFTH